LSYTRKPNVILSARFFVGSMLIAKATILFILDPAGLLPFIF